MTEGRDLPSRARVVIIGGGVIGTSVAYHLAERGCTDVLLLEQGQLSCGTTWHAAGLVGLLRATESGTRLVQYSTELYARLEEETGLSPSAIARCHGQIRAMYNWAIRKRMVTANPGLAADPPKVKPRQLDVPSMTQVR